MTKSKSCKGFQRMEPVKFTVGGVEEVITDDLCKNKFAIFKTGEVLCMKDGFPVRCPFATEQNRILEDRQKARDRATKKKNSEAA